METQETALQGALVTGAAGGIGEVICRRLSSAGTSVALVDRPETADRLDQLAAELGGLSLPCDLRDANQIRASVAVAFDAVDGLSGLVNGAAVYPVTAFVDVSEQEWDDVLDTNLKAPFLISQAFVRGLRERSRGGQVVNITSSAAQVTRPGVAAYASSKAALNHLTHALALELGPWGVRVNAVSPGTIGTEGAHRVARENPDDYRSRLSHIPLGRMGEADDIARAVAFLLDPANAYVTGAVLTVDGGYTCGIPTSEPATVAAG